MKQYVDLLKKIISTGEERLDRTGVGTYAIFGGEVSFDLREKFPLVTIKKTRYLDAFDEMLWFISGDTNIKFLKDRNIKIWDAWADSNGNLGPVYGYQWRKWHGKIHEFSLERILNWANVPESDPELEKYAIKENYIGEYIKSDMEILCYQEKVDQLAILIDMLKNNPNGRRHIVTAWNPGFISEMGLPPCHYTFQCYVSNDKHLDLRMSIRSWDTGLGGPYNIAQYALLTHLIARAANLKPRMLSISYGDAHVYLNHLDLLKERIESLSPIDCNSQLIIKTDNIDIDGYKSGDFEITGYESHPFLKLEVAV